MQVTIIADASWCPDTGAGGYGFWIASQRGKLAGEGAFKEPSKGSAIAEMMAVVNALHSAIKEQLVQKGDKILIQTDCMTAIDIFNRKIPVPVGKDKWKIVGTFDKFIHLRELSYEFRHVKGHTNGGNARLNCNIACDKRAKRAMRKMRTKLKLDKIRNEIK